MRVAAVAFWTIAFLFLGLWTGAVYLLTYAVYVLCRT